MWLLLLHRCQVRRVRTFQTRAAVPGSPRKLTGRPSCRLDVVFQISAA
jgi:hypothetical protein